MRRFFVPSLGAAGATLTLPPAVRRHLAVLRLAPGEHVELFDGSGQQARARLEDDETVTIEALEEAHEPGPKLVLVQALPKGAKADEIVRMATELGVHAIHFVLTEHAVARPDEGRGQKKTSRWQRIAEEAARQSERAIVPGVHAPLPLTKALGAVPTTDLRLVAWARGGVALGALPPATDTTWVAVGPEGGFSDAELDAFDRAGWTRYSLGPHVLRVDTAALAALSQLATR
ncbi:MAG: RsmE family RNA methyltransferase [Polyangiales bacterium]